AYFIDYFLMGVWLGSYENRLKLHGTCHVYSFTLCSWSHYVINRCFRDENWDPQRRYWKHLCIVGVLQTAAVFSLVMYGLDLVEAGKSSVLLYSMPLWSSVLAVPYLKEKLTWRQLTG